MTAVIFWVVYAFTFTQASLAQENSSYGQLLMVALFAYIEVDILSQVNSALSVYSNIEIQIFPKTQNSCEKSQIFLKVTWDCRKFKE